MLARSTSYPLKRISASEVDPARSAFTLMEVLLALGLFAIASAVLVQAAVDALRAYDAVKSDSNREQLYRFALRSILAIQDREELEDGGEFELPNDGRADWEVEIEDAEMVDLFVAQITIEVESDLFASGSAEAREFEVYLYRPEWEAEDGAGILDDRRQNLEDSRRGF